MQVENSKGSSLSYLVDIMNSADDTSNKVRSRYFKTLAQYRILIFIVNLGNPYIYAKSFYRRLIQN